MKQIKIKHLREASVDHMWPATNANHIDRKKWTNRVFPILVLDLAELDELD